MIARFGWSNTEGVPISQCVQCRHNRLDGTCDAFPDGIPMSILTNTFDHRQPHDGDHGIQFEPVPGERHPFEADTE